MKSICLFCGKDHNGKKPQLCELKGALMSSVILTFGTADGMLIVDRSKLLFTFEKELKRRKLLKPARR